MSSSVQQMISKTWKAAINLRQATDKQLKAVLLQLADELEKNSAAIIKANQLDVEKQDPNNPRVDRLLLNKQRIAGIANSIRTISKLPNPAGKTLEKRRLDNGLLLHKIAVPLGVVGAIYESRPNVTYDIAALCIRSQNGCVLKGSSEADNSNLGRNLWLENLKANWLSCSSINAEADSSGSIT